MVMNLYSAFSINALYKQGIYGWDRTSAYIGATGSRYQSISNLTQHMNEWMNEWIKWMNETRPDHNTRSSMPYSSL